MGAVIGVGASLMIVSSETGNHKQIDTQSGAGTSHAACTRPAVLR